MVHHDGLHSVIFAISFQLTWPFVAFQLPFSSSPLGGSFLHQEQTPGQYTVVKLPARTRAHPELTKACQCHDVDGVWCLFESLAIRFEVGVTPTGRKVGT